MPAIFFLFILAIRAGWTQNTSTTTIAPNTSTTTIVPTTTVTPSNTTLSPVPVLPTEIWRRLRNAENGARLHHSDQCNPLTQSWLFKKLINLGSNAITESDLQNIEHDISNTCDWKRHMTCEATRHRCVCAVDAVWIKRPGSMNNASLTAGSCFLRASSNCYGSMEEMLDDPANALGINPPFALCLNDTSCRDGICQCDNPGTKECSEAQNIFQTRVTNLKTRFGAFKWAQHGDLCDFGTNLTIDLRIHTLKILTLEIEQWEQNNVSLERICDFHKSLVCYPDNGDRLGTNGTCVCKKKSTWYKNRCRGEHGSLCEIRIWAEGDAVPYKTKLPCMPELNCTDVKYLGTETHVGACCYTGIYQYRTHELNRTQLYLCSIGIETVASSITLISIIMIVTSGKWFWL